MEAGLFSGLKVLDVGSWIAGPVAGTILADYGADVTKIELPGVGDQYRSISALPAFPDAPDNYMWQLDARNKRSLSLNLKTEEGIDILHRLVAECDVYITNQPFPMRDALNLHYEDLKPLNPSMIYASLSAYGEKGPDRNREGFDLVAYWARTGLMDLVRAPDAPPSQAIAGMGDHPSAVTLYASIVTALLKRERTGEGSMVHTSLLANGIWAAASYAQAGFSGGGYDRFREVKSRRRYPTAVYETSDGRFMQFTMVRTADEVSTLLETIGLPELAGEDRFCVPTERFAHAEELSGLIASQLILQDFDTWMSRFKAAGVAVVRVGLIEDLVDDPQVHENQMVMVPEDDSIASPHLIRHPLNIDGLPISEVRRAPDLGEHTEEILSGLGYSADDLEVLRSKGVI